MRLSTASIVAAAMSFASLAVSANPSEVCDESALREAFVKAWNLQLEIDRAKGNCSPADTAAVTGFSKCLASVPSEAPVSETVARLKICGDAGSPVGAGLYATWLVEFNLAKLRHHANPPSQAELSTLPATSRQRLQRAFASTAADAKAQIPLIAQEALQYYQRSYSLDANEAASAEGIADLLASGDVGTGRKFESLDWYYKAATGYLKWRLPPDVMRPNTTRILEKMVAIDRENPLTKKLESQLYR